jgi:hypothetical protein
MNMPRPDPTQLSALPSDEETDPRPRPRPRPYPIASVSGLGESGAANAEHNASEESSLRGSADYPTAASADGHSDTEESTCSGARTNEEHSAARRPQAKRQRDDTFYSVLATVAATLPPVSADYIDEDALRAQGSRRFTFDEKLQFLDKTKGLSLKDAELVLGVHQQNIRNWRKAEASIRQLVARGHGGHISCPTGKRRSLEPVLGRPFVQIFPGFPM